MLLVLLLPVDHLADRLIKRLEVVAKLLHQVLIEVLNHLSKCIDHRLCGRLRQHLAKQNQVFKKLVLKLVLSTIQAIPEVAHI